MQFEGPNLRSFPDIDSAIEFAKHHTKDWGEEIFIVGGSQIYSQTLPRIDRLYLTEVHAAYQGDATYELPDMTQFSETKHNYFKGNPDYSIIVYSKMGSGT